jgi:hypothetical protein
MKFKGTIVVLIKLVKFMYCYFAKFESSQFYIQTNNVLYLVRDSKVNLLKNKCVTFI